MDETGYRYLSDSVYANDALVFGTADIPEKYAAWSRRYALGKRSAENCGTVRSGFKRKGEYDVCGSCYNNCGESHTFGCSCSFVRRTI